MSGNSTENDPQKNVPDVRGKVMEKIKCREIKMKSRLACVTGIFAWYFLVAVVILGAMFVVLGMMRR
ncbi:MAG: hypothetical protein P4L62_01295 [Candidatus Pacebacteria bacterium]|nr:hypothetical protein [Candidatus Paceibacterota bacterium]MDR3582979.1 hypothetical protein [Candidatus Paceibacterota bacterium]